MSRKLQLPDMWLVISTNLCHCDESQNDKNIAVIMNDKFAVAIQKICEDVATYRRICLQ